MESIILECIEIAKSIAVKLQMLHEVAARKVNFSRVGQKRILGVDRVAQLQQDYDEHLDKIGKDQTISVEQIVELNNKNRMPTMIKHCVVAVAPSLRGEGEEMAFIGAHNICVYSMNKHKLVSKEGRLTGGGQLREKYHKSKKDKNAGVKTSTYNRIYNKIFKK